MYLKIAKFFLYASLFSVLIVLPTLYFPYIVGKATFFRTMIDLAVIAFAFYWAWEKGGERKKPEDNDQKISWLKRLWVEQPLVIAVSVFAIAFTLSCVFGTNPWFSFWSNFERGEGGFQILHYTALFLLAAAILKKEAQWNTLFGVMTGISLAVVGYGIGAALKLPLFIGPAGLFSRLSGTLGNADYAGTFMIFSIFYAVFLISKKEVQAWIKWILGLCVAVFFGFMLLSQTRGAIVGLGAGILAFLIYLAFKAAKKGWLRKGSQIVLAVFVILIALILGGQKYISKIKDCSICTRVLHISFTDFTFKTRYWAWEAALQGWENKPVFGWGPEEYSAAFDRHFNTNYYDPTVQGSETWFDRAHSIYFDYLAETGAVGVLAFLGIFIVFFSQFFKRVKNNGEAARNHSSGAAGHETSYPLSIIQQGLLLSMLVAYLVQGIALFDVLPTYINLMLFLAFANYQFKKYGSRG